MDKIKKISLAAGIVSGLTIGTCYDRLLYSHAKSTDPIYKIGAKMTSCCLGFAFGAVVSMATSAGLNMLKEDYCEREGSKCFCKTEQSSIQGDAAGVDE